MNPIQKAKSEFLQEQTEKFFEGSLSSSADQKQILVDFEFKKFGIAFEVQNEENKITVIGSLEIDGKKTVEKRVLELSNESESTD